MERKRRALALAAVVAAVLLCLVFLSVSALADSAERGVSFKNFEQFGGSWYDVEKSPTNPNDDVLCWAATASNILEYTGWGHTAEFTDADGIFSYYVDHWTDTGSLMDFAWGWWFSGINDSQGWSGWSQVYRSGGGFYSGVNFWDHYHEQWTTSLSMSSIDQFIRAGYGVGLAIYGPGAHAITCWGYNYDPENPDSYYGVWVSDSDDDRYITSPPDTLHYYDVAYSGATGKWYLQDYFGSNSWYIGGVEALDMVPEPASLLSLAAGLAIMLIRRRPA